MLTVQVPATSANLGPGFDSFGLALKLFNRFHLTRLPDTESSRLSIAPGTCVAMDGISLVPEESLFFRTLAVFYQHLGLSMPALDISIEAHIPLARGLGSSSSVIVGALLLANVLEGEPYALKGLLKLATEIEGHPDNVAPALMGGVVMADEADVYPLPWPEGWALTVVVPQYRLLTEKARAVLPQMLPMADAIYNLRKASRLTYAFLQQDVAALRGALQDRLHQPYRGSLIPEFERVQDLLRDLPVYGTVISGAGPSIAVFHSNEDAQQVLQALSILKTPSQKTEQVCHVWPLAVSLDGASVIAAE